MGLENLGEDITTQCKGKIVFSSGKSGDYDIFSVDLLSRDVKQLTKGPYWNDAPKWSPDGKNIVFISNRSGTPEIWVMTEDGSHQTRITHEDKWHATPDWSPDGKRLVFCANYDANFDVYVMNADGSNVQRLTHSEGKDFTPQFSPDGKQVVYTSEQGGSQDIWVCDLSTGGSRQLTTYGGKDFAPTFSPDGVKIAYVSAEVDQKGKQNYEIFMMNSDGSQKEQVTHNPGVDHFVAWSPDGKYLVYCGGKPKSPVERLTILEYQTGKYKELNLDRDPIEHEIDAKPKATFHLFKILPETLIRKTYNPAFFGSERHPDWAF